MPASCTGSLALPGEHDHSVAAAILVVCVPVIWVKGQPTRQSNFIDFCSRTSDYRRPLQI